MIAQLVQDWFSKCNMQNIGVTCDRERKSFTLAKRIPKLTLDLKRSRFEQSTDGSFTFYIHDLEKESLIAQTSIRIVMKDFDGEMRHKLCQRMKRMISPTISFFEEMYDTDTHTTHLRIVANAYGGHPYDVDLKKSMECAINNIKEAITTFLKEYGKCNHTPCDTSEHAWNISLCLD